MILRSVNSVCINLTISDYFFVKKCSYNTTVKFPITLLSVLNVISQCCWQHKLNSPHPLYQSHQESHKTLDTTRGEGENVFFGDLDELTFKILAHHNLVCLCGDI